MGDSDSDLQKYNGVVSAQILTLPRKAVQALVNKDYDIISKSKVQLIVDDMFENKDFYAFMLKIFKTIVHKDGKLNVFFVCPKDTYKILKKRIIKEINDYAGMAIAETWDDLIDDAKLKKDKLPKFVREKLEKALSKKKAKELGEAVEKLEKKLQKSEKKKKDKKKNKSLKNDSDDSDFDWKFGKQSLSWLKKK
jgi:hypothetical protein